MRFAFVLVAFTMVAGCTAPSIGGLPSSGSSSSSTRDKTSDTSGDDDDDDSSESTSVTTSAQKAPSTTVASADAGTKLVACTDSGAVQFQGHCYFALTTAMSWDDSKTACAATGAHLATLTTAAEEDIAEALDKSTDRWIGLSRPDGSAAADASYVWVTTEPRGSFADWTNNEPNGSGSSGTNGSAECTRLVSTGGWADEVCAVKHVPLCERE